jgi:peroxiredoxin
MRHRLSILTALSVALSACSPAVAPRNGSAARTVSLPATELAALDGSTTALPSFLRGRPALVSFWATWCDACADEVPALNRLWAQVRERGDAVVVGIAVGDERARVIDFTERHALAYPQLVDGEFRFADALGERRVPTTLVVDRAGRIVFRGQAFDAASLHAFRRAMAPE